MVRAFKDEDVVHVEGEVDPVRDIKIINNELVQKDLSFVNK
jgi:ribosome-binding ATPase YchF (GTP1/OBG family)